MKRNILSAMIMILAACGGGNGSNLPGERLQALLDKAVRDSGAPGMLLAVQTENGRWIGASGMADLAAQAPAEPDMQVRLASITKTYVAATVLTLVDDGSISLDDTLEDWLPGMFPYGSQVTVRMLLNHTSGVADHEADPQFFEALLADPQKEWSEAEVISISLAHGLNFTPGSAWSYSNTGYYLLGMIVEKAAGRRFEEVFAERIAGPLHLSSTSVTRSGAFSAPFMHPYAHNPLTGRVEDTADWSMSWDFTAGSGVSTPEDMLRFVRGLFSGKLLRPETLREMVSPGGASDSYGYGVFVAQSPTFGELSYSHSGDNPGTLTIWIYLSQSQRAVFVAVNRSDALIHDDDVRPFDATPALAALLEGVAQVFASAE